MHKQLYGNGSAAATTAHKIQQPELTSAANANAAPPASVLVYLYAERLEMTRRASPRQAGWFVGGLLVILTIAALLAQFIDTLLVFLAVSSLLPMWARVIDLEFPADLNLNIGSALQASRIRTMPGSFAAALFVVALWSLWQQGRITLELAARQRRFGAGRARLWVRRGEGDTSAEPNNGGLETLILAHLSETAPMRPEDIIHAWLGDDERVRWYNVVLTAMQHVNDLGGATGDRAAWQLKPAFDAAFGQFVTRWTTLQTREPALYQALLQECRSVFPPDRGRYASDGDDSYDLDDFDDD